MSKKDLLLQTNGFTNGNGSQKQVKKSRIERLEELQKEVQVAIQEEKATKKILKPVVQKEKPTKDKSQTIKEKIHELHFNLIVKERDNLKNKKKLLTKQIHLQEKTIKEQNEKLEKFEHVLHDQERQLMKTFDSSKILQLVEPTLLKSRNPLKLIQNYRKYKKKKKAYETAVKTIAASSFTLNNWHEAFSIGTTGDDTGKYKLDYLTVLDRSLKVGEKWVRMYYLADIPAQLSPYIQFKLLASQLPFTVSLFVQPTPNNILLKKARQRISVLETQQYQREKKGLTRDPQIDRNIEETKVFADDLVYERERGLVYSLYLELEADSQEELNAFHKEFKNLAESMEVVFNTYSFGQKEAFKNLMPFGEDNIREDRIIQSSAGSYLMPFVAKPLYNPEGIFIGTNVYHNSVVFLNPFTTEVNENNNINVFGVSGAGKSVTSKILASRMYMQGTQIIIIDPEGEYVKLARKFGGEVIQFSRDNGINPFSVASEEPNQILDHVTMLKTFFKFFIPAAKYDGAKLDKILVDLYKDYPKEKPTFRKFLTATKNTSMYEDLAILNEGSLKGVFNAERDLELTNDFIVFDLKSLGENEIKPPAMYLLTSLIWQLVNTIGTRQRMLFIDEAHTLLKDDDVAKDYQKLVKQARKRNLGVVSITQDVEDFLNHTLGKAIINNSATKILLKQSYAALGLMDNIFPMTDEEKKGMGSLRKGEVIIFRENDHVAAYIKVLPSERELVFTNYEKPEDR